MFVILHDIAQNAEKVHYEMRFLPEDIRGMIRTEGETIVRLAGGDQQIVVETPDEIEAAIDAAKRAAALRVEGSLPGNMLKLCAHVLDAYGSPTQTHAALVRALPIAATWHAKHPVAMEWNRASAAARRHTSEEAGG